MRSLVIIQARMDSSRLPGKSMMTIGDAPMLDYLVESVVKVFAPTDVVIATSEKPGNDILREYAAKKGLACFSGSENDVASRYYEILSRHKAYDYFFRICGDTPYYDTSILHQGLRIIEEMHPEVISSMPNKGYPMGCNLEAFKTEVFLDNYAHISTPADKEHVTTYFYRNIDKFTNYLLYCDLEGYSYEKYKFSVDTVEDLELAKKMLKEMKYKPWEYTVAEKMDLQIRIINNNKNQ
jgi:spore coat polysaccharide biosynthesis protein SpsF